MPAVLDADTARQLDHPVWSCLTGRHGSFAIGAGRARRYPVDISPIAAVVEASPAALAELEQLFAIGDDIALAGPIVPALDSRWNTLHASHATQMIRLDHASLPEGDVETVALGPGDVPEMLALVELTHPGPFRTRTIELGRFLGVRENGRLVAMAGERMWIAACREVSGVCTHPQAQGRGFAKALMARVINRILRDREVPFLHVDSANRHAIEVYRRLGFVVRAEFPLIYARRVA